MRKLKFLKPKFKARLRKTLALKLVIAMLLQMVNPVRLFALTGGPSQPEVQSFEPVGTSDMVDLFSGDFNYNIPLLDVEGYPVNISYHSGITMDQEASWVGLGWNINPGVINRSMRGLPDDFNGDPVTKEFNMKPNKTYGIKGGVGFELFGMSSLGAQVGLGVHYNNYNGLGIEESLNLSLSLSAGAQSSLTCGLGIGITSSSDDGLSIQPSVSFGAAQKDKQGKETSLSVSVGTCYNSRGGLKQLTINANLSNSGNQVRKDAKVDHSESGISEGGSATFDFSMPTYTPSAGLPMQNLSITGNFKLGAAFLGSFTNVTVGGYYSAQQLATNYVTNPAYGYMNSDQAVNMDNALYDFNREKDGNFTPNTPALPVTNFTYDIFSVSGQGVSGSYRPFRSDMGHVYDAKCKTTSDGYSIGAEVGIGDAFHAGLDATLNDVTTTTQDWIDENTAGANLNFRKTGNPLYENYYFKEANEKAVDTDPSFFASAGGENAVSLKLDSTSQFSTISDGSYAEGGGPGSNVRGARDQRSQPMSVISRGDLVDFGLSGADINLLGLDNGNSYKAKTHHMAELNIHKTDGSRYVYGIAAYNTHQEETTFAVGLNSDGNSHSGDCLSGLVSYTPDVDNTTGNGMGLDNYYSNTIMPAYAHSYLLTAVLSPDYVDADSIKGPSDGDLGSYTKFHYSKIPKYKWRVPVEENMATFNEGLKSDPSDDKANYIYGEKELWYLDTIETKNYIAIFNVEARKDGFGVNGRNGGLDLTNPMNLLRMITLYSKPDFRANGLSATPIKQVHFEYDYSLCPNVPNNSGVSETVGMTNLNASKGKLTLKKIYFTYQNSNKARLSPYEFIYNMTPDYNPDYNIKGYDRWGYYKPNTATSCVATSSDLPTSEYAYVDQDTTNTNKYCQAWSLQQVSLPSGGTINLSYESDDYAYVQNKQAMQMFKIIGVNSIGSGSISGSGDIFYFNLMPGCTDINQYFNGIDNLYFRFLMNLGGSNYDYVSGYATIANKGISAGKGWVQLNGIDLDSDSPGSFNQISKAAIQFGRLNMPRLVWDEPNVTDGFGEQLIMALINSIGNFIDAAHGTPNNQLYAAPHNVGKSTVVNKSWIRLNNPNHKKLGGGSRVKQITVSDSWDTMTGSAESPFSYGQQYSYTNDDGTSSGVASYEPQLGGDENPWKQPVFFSQKNLLASDDEHYMEEPFGECFFPSPSVGYGKVTVTNLQYNNVNHNATGKVVHQFYTAKDFPTIAKRTDVHDYRGKSDPLSITSILHIDVKDYMTASQGYVVELNDMHGKPKSQEVYQQGQTTPITSVEYHYQCDPYLNGSYKLNNQVTVIDSKGNVNPSATIGEFFDFVSDMREHKTETKSPTIQANLDGFFILIPFAIPMVIPSEANETTQFRSAVVTKVIQRFGILKETVAKDLGSTVATDNLAYDSKTGDLLLTQTTTDYNDIVYSLTYPAHWYYNGMGPASANIGFTRNNVTFSSGNAAIGGAGSYFVPGDELGLTHSSGTKLKAWVISVGGNSIHAVDKFGNTVPNATYNLQILRSGRRNQQQQPMAKLTSLSNPLGGIGSNIYDKVLQASAIVYDNGSKTFCDCFEPSAHNADYTTNPYILGTLGMWKPKKSYLHLTGRTQDNYDNNTNIRKDGIFAAYTPFYKLSSGNWQIDNSNWTYTSQVTEFSPFGQELENQDALGRYSAATYGYNQSLPTAVAANAKYSDIGADNFEDYGFSRCADNHFKFNPDSVTITPFQFHTGSHSLSVASGSPANLSKSLVNICTDPNACVMSLNMALGMITETGGMGPFTFDWTVLNGSPVIHMLMAGNGFTISGAHWKIRVTVTDSKGCSAVKIFSIGM